MNTKESRGNSTFSSVYTPKPSADGISRKNFTNGVSLTAWFLTPMQNGSL